MGITRPRQRDARIVEPRPIPVPQASIRALRIQPLDTRASNRGSSGNASISAINCAIRRSSAATSSTTRHRTTRYQGFSQQDGGHGNDIEGIGSKRFRRRF
jgi:hypothetical protein